MSRFIRWWKGEHYDKVYGGGGEAPVWYISLEGGACALMYTEDTYVNGLLE